jgi:hypothetical protein
MGIVIINLVFPEKPVVIKKTFALSAYMRTASASHGCNADPKVFFTIF